MAQASDVLPTPPLPVKNRNGVGSSSGRNVIIGHLPSREPIPAAGRDGMIWVSLPAAVQIERWLTRFESSSALSLRSE